ncbi:MAG TPA: hemerythrin domain-containing protein [Fimbriimonas sp.]
MSQRPVVPSALEKEHEEIHQQLVAATQAPGKTGEAAKALAAVLHPHFEREQQIALPPLGALAKMASGQPDPSRKEAIRLSRILAREMPKMLREHKAIASAAKRLEATAVAEGRHEAAELARKLMLHAKTEEQVTYPAAILVGKYGK